MRGGGGSDASATGSPTRQPVTTVPTRGTGSDLADRSSPLSEGCSVRTRPHRPTAATCLSACAGAGASAGFDNGVYFTVTWSIVPLNLNGALS